MNLKITSAAELLAQTKALVSDERNLTSKILEHLKEIEVRKLYLDRGFSSLFVFCTDFLGYEASQAQRRIVAMRLLKQIPEIKEKIESGALSLTALNQANMFFNASAKSSEALSKDEKVEVLKSLENKSTRECERELIKLNPSIVPRSSEKIRDLTDDLVEVKVVLKRDVMERLSRVKELLSNKDPNINMADLINILAESFLKKNDPLKKENPKATKEQSALTVTFQKPKTRHIPNSIKVIVFKRDNGRCQYVDSVTNRKCNSSYQVEMDHIHPFSLGGSHSIENLTLLCKGHNIHKATKEFGIGLMKKYVPNFKGISI